MQAKAPFWTMTAQIVQTVQEKNQQRQFMVQETQAPLQPIETDQQQS